MTVIEPGCVYNLSSGQNLEFLQRERGALVRSGTTNEEVLGVLIDRLTEGYQVLPCSETIRALHSLHVALAALQERTAVRTASKVEGTQEPVGLAESPVKRAA